MIPAAFRFAFYKSKKENLLPLLAQEAERVVGTKQAIATNNLQLIDLQSQTLESAESQAEQGVDQLPSLIRQYTDLQRELEIATSALTRFRVTQETLAIEAAQTEIPWQLIETPVRPSKPISPGIPRKFGRGCSG